jgi:hypothetical protein
MNKIIVSSFMLILSMTIFAKQANYPVSTIPPALKENAHTVIRLYKQEVEIKSEKLAIANITEVRTILNKNGEFNRYFMEMYNPMNKISNISGKIYDENGKLIRSFGSSDVIDQSYITGYTLFDDNRIKIIDPKSMTYPCTLEYSYQLEMKQTLFLPTWSHQPENTSYESSSFVVKTPADYTLRYKEYNLTSPGTKTTHDGINTYSWSLSNLPVRKDEPLSSIKTPDFPLVRLAPNNFSVGETNGSSENWESLGKWVTALVDGKDELPEATIEKIEKITANCKSDFEKVKVVYEYMQQKTRYVSIQVGIGGWQPFDAETVDKSSYGDCKALSNYTKALLSAAGIKSYYTLVNAGTESNSIDDSFPSSQFNHAIVCVPLPNDTVWLECTSQRMPCGFNGDFTDDRQVLIIDGDHSRLIRTRIYPSSENMINRTTTISLKDETSGEANVKANYLGLAYDQLMPIFYADNTEKEKMVVRRIKLPSFSLKHFNYTENRSKTPSFDENLEISFSNYLNNMGDVILLPVNFMSKLKYIPEKVRNRKTEMCIRRSSVENDTVIYHLPINLEATELPGTSQISSKFGKYIASTNLKDGKINYVRHFELFKGTFPAEAYTEFRNFLEEVSTADAAVVSLKKLN